MTTEAGKGKSPNFISNPLNQAVVRNNWSGHWIWPEAVKADRNAYAFFRREFRSTREEKLTIHITANNFYWLYLDGKFIGRGPVRSFPEYYSFDTFELNVEPGNHCLAAMVHHVGESNATIVVGRPGFLADVFACDVNLSTGDGWKCI
ncbi:MAG: hypothetical protein WCP55_20290, partial [Lentisphaerota bacterium]